MANVKIYYTGGTGNTDPNSSLGGDISSASPPAELNNLFSNITEGQANDGKTDYRCLALKNDGPEPFYNAKIWVDSQVPEGANAVMGFKFSNETQKVRFLAAAAGGTFQFLYTAADGTPYSKTVAWGATPSQTAHNFQKQLNTIPGLQSIDVEAEPSYTFVVYFKDNAQYRQQPLLLVNGAGLVPPTTASVTRERFGGPINSPPESIPNESTLPDGVCFSEYTANNPLNLGTLYSGDFVCFWIARYVQPDTPPLAYDGLTVKASGGILYEDDEVIIEPPCGTVPNVIVSPTGPTIPTTPAVLPVRQGLSLWIDATAVARVHDGAPLGSIPDGSNYRHSIVAMGNESAKRPKYRARCEQLHNMPAIDCSTSDNGFILNNWAGRPNKNIHMFVVSALGEPRTTKVVVDGKDVMVPMSSLNWVLHTPSKNAQHADNSYWPYISVRDYNEVQVGHANVFSKEWSDPRFEDYRLKIIQALSKKTACGPFSQWSFVDGIKTIEERMKINPRIMESFYDEGGDHIYLHDKVEDVVSAAVLAPLCRKWSESLVAVDDFPLYIGPNSYNVVTYSASPAVVVPGHSYPRPSGPVFSPVKLNTRVIIGEIVIYNRKLSNQEADQVYSYLMSKWKIGDVLHQAELLDYSGYRDSYCEPLIRNV